MEIRAYPVAVVVGSGIPPHKSFRFSIESKLNELREEGEEVVVDSFFANFLRSL